jgi:peptidoglycan/xylan/chitin deacetylase (PgdA/CDA1 family)
MDRDQTSRPAPGPGPRRPRQPGPLNSPLLATGLAIIVIGLVAALLTVPGLIPRVSPSPAGCTSTPCGPNSSPTLPTVVPTLAPSPTFVRPTPTPAPTFTSYVVQAGDNLNSIARKFGTTARSIAWWNRGTYPSLDPESPNYAPNNIQLGWVLVLIPGVVVDDNNPPTPSPGPPTPAPTPSPGVTPSAAPAASPSATTSAAATLISHGSRTSSEIALTFDMGGRLDPAVDIVQWLIDHETHATLFPTGKAGTTTDLGRQALLLAASRPDLFVLGNHSWDHPDFTTLTAAKMATQLTSTETAVHDLIGMTTKPYFRPPYGAWTYAVRVGVGAAGWHDLVMWDVDTIDWKATADGGPTAADIVAKVATKAQGGSIVLMHLGGWHTLEALPGILQSLESSGLRPVTLTELLAG